MVALLPQGNLPGWNQILAQNFPALAAEGSFTSTYPSIPVYHNQLDTSKNGTYRSETLSVVSGVAGADGNVLKSTLRYEGGMYKVSAPLPLGYGGTTYGRYSVRMKADNLPRYKVAFMLWPKADAQNPGGNWSLGEEDFPEGQLNTGSPMYGNQHALGASPGDVPYPFNLGVSAADWHDYTMEWLPGLMRYYVDDVLVQTTTRDVPTTPHNWILQIETQLDAANPPDIATTGGVYIDWVAAWQPIAGYNYELPKTQAFTPDSTGPTAPATSVRGTNNVASSNLVQVTSTAQWSSAQTRLNTYFTDGQITATVRPPASGGTSYLGLRYNPATDTGYVASINAAGLVRFGWWVNATFTQLGSYTATVPTGVNLDLKVEARAGGFKVKAWQTGTAEPATWGIGEIFSFNDSGGDDIVLMTQTSAAAAATSSWAGVRWADTLTGAQTVVATDQGVTLTVTLEQRLRAFATSVGQQVKAVKTTPGAYASAIPGSTFTVTKTGSTWPARPTARTDVTVQWKGADPSPAIVSSGTGGMIDGVDIRLVTP